jgi:hypothetical protein
LGRIGSAHIDQLAAGVAAMVQRHPMKVSNLDSVLKGAVIVIVPMTEKPTHDSRSPFASRLFPHSRPAAFEFSTGTG